jgi:hypothetical protein
MPLAQLLLISFAILGAIVLALVRAPTLRHTLVRPRVVLTFLGLSVSLSTASALITTSGASGTGTRRSYGFPKPFYFTWISWEQPVSNAGFEWLYFAGNCVSWFAIVSVVAVFWAVVRRSRGGMAPAA